MEGISVPEGFCLSVPDKPEKPVTQKKETDNCCDGKVHHGRTIGYQTQQQGMRYFTGAVEPDNQENGEGNSENP